jgi:hypothetical protein
LAQKSFIHFIADHWRSWGLGELNKGVVSDSNCKISRNRVRETIIFSSGNVKIGDAEVCVF